MTVIKDHNMYHSVLYKTLSENRMIETPKTIEPICDVFYNRKDEIIGWEIYDKQIKFISNEILDCDEYAVKEYNKINICKFSYHFHPNNTPDLLSYRIDLESDGELHMNTDVSLKNTLGDHLQPDGLSLNIYDFNCVFAIYLALSYMNKKIYPAIPDANIYNTMLNGLRRQFI